MGRAKRLVAIVTWYLLSLSLVASYTNPEINRRAMAGVWRLSSKRCFLPMLETSGAGQQHNQFPMKEFTVYPKKKRSPPPPMPNFKDNEMLLMLNEDGRFTQYGEFSFDVEEDDEDAEEAEGTVPGGEEIGMGVGVMKGTWDFLDGKLILAADRPKDADAGEVQDTVLVGEVVATSEKSLEDNPALEGSQVIDESRPSDSGDDDISSSDNSGSSLSTGDAFSSTSSIDVHLSVPEGSVEIGKFMYPKKHPSFFEQPMFKSTPTGSFQLRQVLGSLNTQAQKGKDELEEKFKKEDLCGKTFFLTSHPIQYKRKGKMRWSIKYNKFVEDKPRKSKEEEEREAKSPVLIRVMEIELFKNNTFSTQAGLGSIILRGKWSIIGEVRDQLWMQVSRFGFGRSAPGSTYSEGKGLSHSDEKAYWGKIREIDQSKGKDDDQSGSSAHPGKKVEVEGSVLDGWGLEPTPVARFSMIEKTEASIPDTEDEEDDGSDADDFYNKDDTDETQFGYDPFSSPDAFQ